MNRLALALGLGLAAIAAAHPPAATFPSSPAPSPGVRVRQFEIPQPPLVIDRPPRVFQEVTQTFEITADWSTGLDLGSIGWAPRADWSTWAPPADSGPRFNVTRFGLFGGVHHFSRDGRRVEILRMGPLGGVRHFSRDR